MSRSFSEWYEFYGWRYVTGGLVILFAVFAAVAALLNYYGAIDIENRVFDEVGRLNYSITTLESTTDFGREENTVYMYLDRSTGEEVYVRSGNSSDKTLYSKAVVNKYQQDELTAIYEIVSVDGETVSYKALQLRSGDTWEYVLSNSLSDSNTVKTKELRTSYEKAFDAESVSSNDIIEVDYLLDTAVWK